MRWIQHTTTAAKNILKRPQCYQTLLNLDRKLPALRRPCQVNYSASKSTYHKVRDQHRLSPFVEQNRSMGDQVHSTAKEGFQEGSFYDQNRPSYTDEVVSRVYDNLYNGPSEGVRYHVLEMGAGTGKFTRKILERFDKSCSYLALEPSDSFLSVLKDTMSGIETMVCSADNIPLPDNSVQNIICAQCFHWFATEESLREMTRVLVPEGRILLIWNNKQWDVDWVKETEEVLTRYYDNTPRAVTREWKKVIEAFKPLSLVEHNKLPGLTNMKGDKKFVVDHFSSISVIARLEADRKAEAQSQFRAVLDKYFPSDNGTIHIPFDSEFYCVRKSI